MVNNERCHRANEVLYFAMNTAYPDDNEGEGEVGTLLRDLFTDIYHLVGAEEMYGAFLMATTHYREEVGEEAQRLKRSPITQEQFKDGSMRRCPVCQGDATESDPTDENAPVPMHCNTCNSSWDIIWEHCGYELTSVEGKFLTD